MVLALLTEPGELRCAALTPSGRDFQHFMAEGEQIVALSDYGHGQECCIMYNLTLIKLLLCF